MIIVKQTLEIEGQETQTNTQHYRLSRSQFFRRFKGSGPEIYILKTHGKLVRKYPNGTHTFEVAEQKEGTTPFFPADKGGFPESKTVVVDGESSAMQARAAALGS